MTRSVYVPVDGVLSAVKTRVDDALPTEGTVTGLGRLTVTPSGAAPFQPAVRFTVELKPSTDASTIVADCVRPGVSDTTAGDG